MEYRAVLFDLDGTLLDTLDDLANSMNEALLSLGFPGHPVDAYRYFIGDGIAMLARRALPEEQRSAQTVANCVERMKTVYQRRWAEISRPYDGIVELLARLNEMNVPIAVLSNKPDTFTQEAVAHFFGKNLFFRVLGAGRFPEKPDPSSALHIAHEMGVAPGSAVYVGDSDIDMMTARRAGMFAVGVSWGFRSEDELRASGAELILSTPEELLQLFAHRSQGH